MKTNTLLAIIVAVGSLVASTQYAHALGTAFGYEGQLIDSGSPATGLYDFTFSLFDAPSGGNMVGNTIISNAIPTTNGLFNISLDFGPGIFIGPNYWLDVNVRTNGSIAGLTDLGRAALTATPYALYAPNAGSVAANSVTGANIQLATITATNIASGQVVRSMNGLKDDVSLFAGSNVTLTPIGNTLTITAAGAGGSGIWSLNATNTFYNTGYVGIGTASPTAQLDVLQPSTATAFQGLRLSRSGKSTQTFLGIADGDYGYFDLGGGTTIRGGTGGGLGSTFGGNVGIGTSNPSDLLEIYGTAASKGIRLNDGTYFHKMSQRGDTLDVSANAGAVGSTGDIRFNVGGPTATKMIVNRNGNVGIGTSSPGFPLTVVAAPGLDAISWQNGTYELGRLGVGYDNNSGSLELESSGALKVRLVPNGSTYFNGGNVGIGTATPAWPLDVQAAQAVGRFVSTGSGIAATIELKNNQPGPPYLGSINFNDAVDSYQGQIAYATDSGFQFRVLGQVRMWVNAGGTGIGRSPSANRLEVEGNASKTAAGSWLANSDARIKTNVRSVENALEKLNQVRLVSFRYTEDYRRQHPSIIDQDYLNVIAQEFQKVFPNAVKNSGDKLADGSQILQVDTYPLTIYSAAAIQEMSLNLKDKEAKITKLEQQAANFQQQIAELKSAQHTAGIELQSRFTAMEKAYARISDESHNTLALNPEAVEEK